MKRETVPRVAWQMTGNHWVTLPCIHPDDASIHLLGLVHRGARGAIEFAGSAAHAQGTPPALISLALEIDGTRTRLAAHGIAWERISDWIPSFVSTAGGVTIRGAIFAPHGKDADMPGVVFCVSFENRSDRRVEIGAQFDGCLGHRGLRIRSERSFADAHIVAPMDDGAVLLEGDALPGLAALAVACDGEGEGSIGGGGDNTFSFARRFAIEPGGRENIALYMAAGAERDGAAATLAVLRRKGWRDLFETTVRALQLMSQGGTGSGVARMIDRNLLFAYFYGVARAIDDAQFYLMRTRAPWHARGITSRDWESLVWLLPAIQLAESALARELILRACEVHGYAPGHGLRYVDGAIFEPGFSLEGASAYAIAIERYIRDTGDSQIVEEPALADTLYLAHAEISRRRDSRYPLYSTEVQPDGEPARPAFTLHGNAVVAYALDILSRTLDEETARDVEPAEAVRAAIMRHFSTGAGSQEQLVSAIDLSGGTTREQTAASTAHWLPLYELLDRGNSTYRRTVRETPGSGSLAWWCAQLVGPAPEEALSFLRRAPLYEGIACEEVDADGRAAAGAGDAALAGLLAWTAWHAIHVLGVKAER